MACVLLFQFHNVFKPRDTMNKFILLVSLFIITAAAPSTAYSNSPLRLGNNGRNSRTTSPATGQHKADSIYESVRQRYAQGKISADSVVSLALYHKTGNLDAAERCLKLAAADNNPRALLELGVIYTFSPEYAKQAREGIKLLNAAAKDGLNEANCYLGLYYFNHKDYAKAKACFDACSPIEYGFGYTALGSMYLEGKGVSSDNAKARENYRQAALKGYPRGMALYGFNMRASAAGPISYPDSFFWLYIAGDLGDDAARTALYLPRRNEKRGDTETAKDALTALQFIELAQSGKKIKNDPIYKDGFLPSLKAREQAAEQGDDWARFYLGSMNYNGDFLNQNYRQALRYYEPIASDGKLPRPVLALVNERLSQMYRDGKGVKTNKAKAAQYARMAARYGSEACYKMVENNQ